MRWRALLWTASGLALAVTACTAFSASDATPAGPSGPALDAEAPPTSEAAAPPPASDGGLCDVADADTWDDFERDTVTRANVTLNVEDGGVLRIDTTQRFCRSRSLRVEGRGKAHAALQGLDLNHAGNHVQWSFLIRVDIVNLDPNAQVHFAKLIFEGDAKRTLFFLYGAKGLAFAEQSTPDVNNDYRSVPIDGLQLNMWQEVRLDVALGAKPHVVIRIGDPGAPAKRYEGDLMLSELRLTGEQLGVSFANDLSKFGANYDRDVLIVTP